MALLCIFVNFVRLTNIFQNWDLGSVSCIRIVLLFAEKESSAFLLYYPSPFFKNKFDKMFD